jgi:hypothetical protein
METFIHVPISEDAGFYAYMAKAVANGAILHRDISISTHSSYIYLIALFFKFFEPSIFLYRMLAIIPEIILTATLSIWLKKKYGIFLATIAIIILIGVLNNPHVTLDVGRNTHLLALVFLWGAIYLLLIKKIPSALMAGILLGLAATVREPYILYGIPLLAIAFKRNVALNYFFGGTLVASLWFVFLDSEGQLYPYLNDILISGGKFRYGGGGLGFFDPARIIFNIGALQHGAKNFYGAFLCMALLAYIFQGKDSVINGIKYLLLPTSLFIELCVNKTVEYSIQPIMLFVVILLAEFLNRTKGSIQFTLSKLSIGVHPNIFLFIIIIVSSWSFLVANWNEYSNYIEVSNSNKNNVLFDSIPLRVLSIINQVPHESISTVSAYPLLFLSKQNYPNIYPFVEDLTAGINLGRGDITRSQIEALKTEKIDIIITKTSTEFTNSPDDFDNAIKNYLLIAEFSKPLKNPVVSPYAERVYFSKNLIDNQFLNIENQNKKQNNAIEVRGASLVRLTNLASCHFIAFTDGNPRISSKSNKGNLYIWTGGAIKIEYQQTGFCNTMNILLLQLNNIKN